MSNVVVKVIDTHHPENEVLLSDLTQTALGSLIFQCKRLLESLEDAEAAIDD